MLKKINWKVDLVLSIKLRDDLYSIAQMRANHLMQFFDIRNSSNNWTDIDLNQVQPLFCIYVAASRIKSLFDSIIIESSVIPNQREVQRKMLNALPIVDSRYMCAVDLIELDDSFDSVNARILKRNLLPTQDADALRHYELTGMCGNSEKLRERLVRYFDEGVNWDVSKSFIFGEDLRP